MTELPAAAYILVVDDNATVASVVERTLARAGHQVTLATSAEGALQTARERPPALLLVNHALLDGDAETLCVRFAEDAALAAVPIVVMSPHEDQMEERYAGLRGVVDTLAKPFSPEALLALIGHRLEKAAPAASVAAPLLPQVFTLPPRPNATPTTGEAGAALSGDLGVVSVGDVLALVQDQALSGVFTLEHPGARIEVWFADGRVQFASAAGVPEEFLLGRFLVEIGALTPSALSAAVKLKGGPDVDLPLGERLVKRGAITTEALRRAIALQTSALIYEGLRWGEGRFWFRAAAAPPPLARSAGLSLNVDGVVMEGLRRIDEWRLIGRAVGDFDGVFVRDEERIARFGRDRLLRDEATVLELVNGKHTVRDIIAASGLGSFDVTKMLFRLLRGKLVRRRVAPVVV